MTAPILSYLRKWFDHTYSSYSPEWLTAALECFPGQSQDYFLQDVACIYKEDARNGTLTSNLVMIIETDATIEALFYYRLARSVYLRENKHPVLRYLANLMRTRTGTEIYYSADIGPRIVIGHGTGLVIGPQHVIGSDFAVYNDVTIGQRYEQTPRQTMVIGNRCTVCTGAKVLGALRLGDNVRIAAGAVLLADAESDCTYAGVPAVKVASAKPDSRTDVK
jgi:serine O-acetyltransferase